MSYLPAIVRKASKGSIQAWPTFYCRKEELLKESGMREKDMFTDLERGVNLAGIERYSCVIPIVPDCLKLVNIKSVGGRISAANVLLGEAFHSIPTEILTNNGKIRFDPKRFEDYSRYMDSVGWDFAFGELYGKPNSWAYNCYVKVPIEGIDMHRELPVMMVYNNPVTDVGLWYIGEENGILLFMPSTDPSIRFRARITGTTGKGVGVSVRGVGNRVRVVGRDNRFKK